MPEIIRRNKALSVNPLKASQPVGGTLATLGFNRAMPMLHGSQGCTAFAKVYFVRHFREPIPLQSTAMDQSSSIMGADENVIEGLRTVAEKSSPDLITVLTTGLSETQGTDVKRCVKEFRAKYPQYGQVAIVAVNTPDFSGCLESGYAATLAEILTELTPNSKRAGARPQQVNVLAGPMLTSGDIEHLRDIIEGFGLRRVFVPDVSDSLDGHLTAADFSPITVGGTPLAELQTLGEATATLVVGASLKKAADILEQRTRVPCYRFDHLYGLHATDALMLALAQISDRPVPPRLERQRAQLQDAMVDTHFMLGFLRVAIAADPDQLNAFAHLVQEMGGITVAAVAAGDGPALVCVPVVSVKIGDLEDLALLAREAGVELIIGNSHAVQTAEQLGVPILRCGFPLYDMVGGYQKTFIGYAGSRQTLFELANLALSRHSAHEVPMYRSIYGQKPASEFVPQPLEGPAHGAYPQSANC